MSIVAMLTKNISFCGSVCQNIIAADYKTHILAEIESKYGVKIIRKHHVPMNNAALSRVRKVPHLVCLRSNGNPYFIYLTRYHTRNVCIFIDKKIQHGYTLPRMVVSPFQFSNNLFDGTILDGEMVKDDAAQWVFLINDVHAHMGRPQYDVNLVERLRTVDAVMEGFSPGGNDICTFQIKKYFKVTDISFLTQRFAQDLPYTNRGILFKSLHPKFPDSLYNFDDSLIKKASRQKIDKGRVMSNDDLAAIESTLSSERSNSPILSAMSTDFSSCGSSLGDCEEEMRIAKGIEVDSYIVSKCATQMGMLHVKNLQQSLRLRSLFLDQPVNKYIDMTCFFNNKFGKWEVCE